MLPLRRTCASSRRRTAVPVRCAATHPTCCAQRLLRSAIWVYGTGPFAGPAQRAYWRVADPNTLRPRHEGPPTSQPAVRGPTDDRRDRTRRGSRAGRPARRGPGDRSRVRDATRPRPGRADGDLRGHELPVLLDALSRRLHIRAAALPPDRRALTMHAGPDPAITTNMEPLSTRRMYMKRNRPGRFAGARGRCGFGMEPVRWPSGAGTGIDPRNKER